MPDKKARRAILQLILRHHAIETDYYSNGSASVDPALLQVSVQRVCVARSGCGLLGGSCHNGGRSLFLIEGVDGEFMVSPVNVARRASGSVG